MQRNPITFITAAAAATVAMALAAPVYAQSTSVLPPAAPPVEEAAAIAQYWTLLAQRRYEEAGRTAADVLKRYPKNISALSLVVETTIASAGAPRALDEYESWLGNRTLEEPGVLRRIARAYLHEWGRQTREANVQQEALLALARDGETVPAPVRKDGEQPGRGGDQNDSSRLERAVRQMNAEPGVKIRQIQRVADAGNARAAEALVPVLRDAWPENRAAAAHALGRIGRPQDVVALRPLLQDPHGAVRVAAAGALYRLGDTSGAQVLLDLTSSDSASMRLTAATLLASQPDENWKSLIRTLAADPDPSIRVDAARLIAPHDPAFARSVLESLSSDSNLAIREQADTALVASFGSDFAVLRRVLRTGSGMAKVQAADRILALTR